MDLEENHVKIKQIMVVQYLTLVSENLLTSFFVKIENK
ncbi:hypothetical protein NY10_2449 [Carnobacterium antarcticum]|nr:hypothetical protein NY10_35 [Carnobacterium sp. CP1]ALV23033.1 hypothetical protein NY10_2449 [Carnobacterium sp. CP1]